jgi:FkbM family methyltransferase
MRMISYAQNGEDVLLDRLFRDREEGFYIDVGACHPIHCSVTKHFYDRGWRGINIEPITAFAEMLRSWRPRDINLNLGLSDQESELTFYEAPASLGMSTFSEAQAADLRRLGHELVERRVPVTTLRRICEQYGDRPFDFLKIDAESHEREVIRGGDWERWRPRAVVVEATGADSWEPLLLEAHYLFATFDGINRYYIREEDRSLLPKLRAPVNITDDFVTYEHHGLVNDLRSKLQEAESALTRACAQLQALRQELDSLHEQLAEARRAGKGLAEDRSVQPCALRLMHRVDRLMRGFSSAASQNGRATRSAG